MISFSVKKNMQMRTQKIPKVTKNLLISLNRLKNSFLTAMMLSKEPKNSECRLIL